MSEAGTLLCDLDGTIFEHGTGDLLEGAAEFLRMHVEAGYRIVFITRRGDKEWGRNHPKYSEAMTRANLAAHNLGHHTVVFDCHSPRILVDDSQIGVVPMETNEGFSPSFLDEVADEMESAKAER